MTDKKKRKQIYDDMRRYLFQGVTTTNKCNCGMNKRTDLEKCICCLSDELREVEGRMG